MKEIKFKPLTIIEQLYDKIVDEVCKQSIDESREFKVLITRSTMDSINETFERELERHDEHIIVMVPGEDEGTPQYMGPHGIKLNFQIEE